jgi:DNA-binding LytR/AlgR family response regulator
MDAARPNFHILLVEDEAVLALDLTDILEAEGYTVVGPVASGPEALDLFRQQPVDLLLCDVRLQGPWDGIETARRLLAERQVPLVYLTALADRSTLMRALETTPAAYLTKPVSVASLRAAVEVARHAAGNVAPAPVAAPNPRPASEARELMLRRDNFIYLKYNYQFVRLALSDIVVLEADNTSTIVVTAGPRYSLRMSLAAVLEQLRYAALVRVHRSFALNLMHVTAFSDTEAIAHGISVPLGRQYKGEFLRHFHA